MLCKNLLSVGLNDTMVVRAIQATQSADYWWDDDWSRCWGAQSKAGMLAAMTAALSDM
jgi:hypothetical protein